MYMESKLDICEKRKNRELLEESQWQEDLRLKNYYKELHIRFKQIKNKVTDPHRTTVWQSSQIQLAVWEYLQTKQ